VHAYPSDMAQNFWGAIWAWTSCFAITIVVSLATAPRPATELTGLVYGLTPRIVDAQIAWYARPAVLGAGVLVLTLALNVLFW
jgi:SSS family solute:Na+ symporter